MSHGGFSKITRATVPVCDGVPQRQPAAVGVTEDRPAVETERLAERLEVGDQVVLGDRAVQWVRVLHASLVYADQPQSL
jgi:hypothetical protein